MTSDIWTRKKTLREAERKIDTNRKTVQFTGLYHKEQDLYAQYPAEYQPRISFSRDEEGKLSLVFKPLGGEPDRSTTRAILSTVANNIRQRLTSSEPAPAVAVIESDSLPPAEQITLVAQDRNPKSESRMIDAVMTGMAVHLKSFVPGQPEPRIEQDTQAIMTALDQMLPRQAFSKHPEFPHSENPKTGAFSEYYRKMQASGREVIAVLEGKAGDENHLLALGNCGSDTGFRNVLEALPRFDRPDVVQRHHTNATQHYISKQGANTYERAEQIHTALSKAGFERLSPQDRDLLIAKLENHQQLRATGGAGWER